MLSPADASTLSGDPLDAAHVFLRSLDRPGALLVAVSGGGDSMALLVALDEARRLGAAPGRRLVAATVDHALRSGSAEEARTVARFCAGRGIEHHILEWTGEKPASGVQTHARTARYRLLSRLAETIGAVAVATAHTFDDQAETIAMRAARIADPDSSHGLAGMAPTMLFERRLWVLRPYLGVSRATLRRWLAERRLDWVDDPSNADERYERARLRLAGGAAADRRDVAARQDERRRHGDRLAALLSDRASLHGGAIVAFDTAGEVSASPDFHAAVATVMALVGGRSHRPGAATNARLAAFLAGSRPGRMTAARAVADRRRGRLYLYRERRGLERLCVEAGRTECYDGRYDIAPSSALGPVLIVPGPAADDVARPPGLADVPSGVAARALAGELVVAAGGFACYACAGSRPDLSITRRLGLFDAFLPLFDVSLADRCAALFDLPPYPPAPFRG